MKKQLKKMEGEVSKGFWKSLGITFLATFLVAITPALGAEDLSWIAIKNGALAGVIFSAIRLAVKSVFEFVIAYFNTK